MPTPPPHSGLRLPLVSLILGVLLALLAPLARAQNVRPITDRLDAIVSYPLVIAISAQNERDLRNGVLTRLDDGRTLQSTPYWVGVTPKPSLPGWLPPQGVWSATPYERIKDIPRERRPAGSWFVEIPIPIDAVGQGLWFGQDRYELNWVPDPERSMLEAGGSANDPDRSRRFAAFWSTRLPDEALADPTIARAIEAYHHDPFQNWRARLLTDGLDPGRSRARETSVTVASTQAFAPEPGDNSDEQGLALLAALARQHEARWQVILGRVWLIDADIATKLKNQLMRTARFGDRVLPVWPSDTTELSRLAHDLLSPFVDDRTRVLRASAWLQAQPGLLSWVIDDQGQAEAGTRRLLPTLGVIALPQSPGSSVLRVQGDAPTPELTTLATGVAAGVSFPITPAPILPGSTIVETTTAQLRMGRLGESHEIIASPIPASAPYVRIGPLLNDWSMNALLTKRPLEGAGAAPSRATVGVLRRAAPPSRDNPTHGWQLYIECASTQPTSENETLTLWIGPTRYPYAVWSITPTGSVTRVRGVKTNLGEPTARTLTLADRWVATIDLPAGVFDSDNQLLLGIERTDADGVHTAWPRRMIPDQPEPGRLLILGDRYDQLSPR